MKAALALSLLALSGLAQAQAGAEALARKHNCLSCHDLEKPKVGPAFKEIAKRYADDARADRADHTGYEPTSRPGVGCLPLVLRVEVVPDCL